MNHSFSRKHVQEIAAMVVNIPELVKFTMLNVWSRSLEPVLANAGTHSSLQELDITFPDDFGTYEALADLIGNDRLTVIGLSASSVYGRNSGIQGPGLHRV